uniref:phosphoethanolamine N-methyltransferase n=1 Tax=Parastrongyloides trichosuri TaxID=131310 RepID=A0A0N4ZZH1_PARTI
MPTNKNELVLAAINIVKPTRGIKGHVISGTCLGEGKGVEEIFVEELWKHYGENVARNSEMTYSRNIRLLFEKKYVNRDILILCDILTTAYIDDKPVNCDDLLDVCYESLNDDGCIILKENFKKFDSSLLGKINKQIQECYLVRFHEMNQIRYSIHTEGNFLDIFWILTKEDKSFTHKKIFQFFKFVEEYRILKADVKSFSGKEFFHFIDYNEKEHWELLDRFDNLRPGAKMLQVGYTNLHLQTVVRYRNNLVLVSPYCETIVDSILYNHKAKDNRIFYRLANFHVHNFPVNCYDLIFVPNFLHYNSNYERFFDNAYTALKFGGEISITCLVLGPGNYNEEFDGMIKFYRLFIKKEREIKEMMENVGFKDIVIERLTDMLSVKVKKIVDHETITFTHKKATFLNNYINSRHIEFIYFYGKKV